MPYSLSWQWLFYFPSTRRPSQSLKKLCTTSPLPTAVSSAQPQQQPQGEHLGPGHLQPLDEQAKEEGLGRHAQALQGLAGGREEQHAPVLLTAQEAAGERHVAQVLHKLPCEKEGRH